MSDVTRPAAWLSDPTGRHQYRYWNGTAWTDQVADNQVTSTDPPLMDEGTAPAAEPGPGAAVPANTASDPDTGRAVGGGTGLGAVPEAEAGRVFSWLARRRRRCARDRFGAHGLHVLVADRPVVQLPRAAGATDSSCCRSR